MTLINKKTGFATCAIHAGEELNSSSSHTNPIFQTSTFRFTDAEMGHSLFSGKRKGYIYSRLGNPTVKVLENKIAALEGKNLYETVDGKSVKTKVYPLAFASGMSATATVVMAVLSPGDHLITDNILYGCTNDLFLHTLKRYKIGVSFIDCSNLDEVKAELNKFRNTKMVFLETPANPTMKLSDIKAIAELCGDEVCLVVDNTFATPILQRPLELGAKIVIHSTTKYISGHGTVIGGVTLTTDQELFEKKLYPMIIDTGGIPSPHDAWLANMGLKTLALRMERHCQNAMEVANWLVKNRMIEKVYYPGLDDFPQKELAERQMDGFGGVISFEVKGEYEAAKKVLNSVKLCTLAVSLGCVDSLIQHPYTMTHNVVPEDIKDWLGITPGMIRLSVGIEDVADIIDDLDQAIGNINKPASKARSKAVR